MLGAIAQREVTGNSLGGLPLAKLYIQNGNRMLGEMTLLKELRHTGYLDNDLQWTHKASRDLRLTWDQLVQDGNWGRETPNETFAKLHTIFTQSQTQ